MPPFRNPFGKKPPVANGTGPTNDENARPSLGVQDNASQSSYAGSRASSSLSIKKKEEPSEYKLSGKHRQLTATLMELEDES